MQINAESKSFKLICYARQECATTLINGQWNELKEKKFN